MIRRESCPVCGSRDNVAVYPDGGKFCFSYCGYKVVSPDYFADTKTKKSNKQTKPEVKEKVKDSISPEKAASIKESTSFDNTGYRGVSEATNKFYGVRYAYNDDDSVAEVFYPITRDNELSGYKVREHPKFFTAIGATGNDCDLFGAFRFRSGGKYVLVTEGECLLPSTKVLTRNGWVTLEDYSGGEVMQGNGVFAEPTAKIYKDYTGDILTYKSGSYQLTMTPNHNMVRIDKNDNKFKTTADNIKHKSYNVPRTVNYSSDEDNLLTRILVMVSADFTLRKEGDLYATFKKERKISRCRELLDLAGIRYSCTEVSNGYTSVFIHRGHNLDVSRLFSFERDFDKAKTVIDEILHWDGNSVPNRNQIEYSSKYLENAEFIQTCAHVCGCTSSIISRESKLGKWYKVSILFGKQTSSTQKGFTKEHYSGKVACLTVPDGTLLVKQNNSISVTGNCDALSAYQMLQDYSKSKGLDYVTAVVSITTGAGNPAKQLQANYDFLNSFDTIVLGFDSDKAGQDAVEKSVSSLPKGKVKIINWSKHKDANDYLMKDDAKRFLSDFYNAKTYVPAGVVASSDLYDKILSQASVQKVSLPPFAKKLEDMLGGGLTLGHIYNIAAQTGIGKTSTVNEFIHYWIFNSPHLIGIVSMELNSGQYGEVLLSRHIKQKLARLNEDEKSIALKSESIRKKADELFNNEDGSPRFYLVDDRDGSVEQLQGVIEEMIIGSGVKIIVLDVLQDIIEGMSNEEQGIFMKWCKSMIKSHNVSFVLINHMRKKSDGTNSLEVSEDDIHGSSTIMKSSSANILLSRNKNAEDDVDRNTTFVMLSKNRIMGDTGPAGKWYYDKYTHVMHDFDDYFEHNPRPISSVSQNNGFF